MRLFYALMPSAAVIAGLRPLMTGVAGARWQSDEQLHLTLRFIGDVSGPVVDDLISALPDGLTALPPLSLSGVGYFETRDRPNALWVSVEPKEPLARLHRKFDRICQRVGLDAEARAYRPHITVARLARTAGPIGGWIGRHSGFALTPAVFTRCSLIESIPTHDGSHYVELASARLP